MSKKARTVSKETAGTVHTIRADITSLSFHVFID